jgi:hypothetical protein
VNQLDIAEVNVKRAAVSAEFGRAAALLPHAVSRSGSNNSPALHVSTGCRNRS